MKIKILGSGGWEGIPIPFCNCRVCKVAKKNLKSKDNRTRPEILVETDKGKFLIEISPDIRLQSTRFNLLPIKDFLISHWHFDHMYGFLELHAWSEFIMNGEIKLYCSQKTKEWLDKNFAHIPKEIVILKQFQNFELYDIKITTLPVYHMFSQDRDLEESKLENTFGFLLEKENKKIAYLPDYFEIPQKTMSLIKNSDIVIMDGTYLLEEQFPNKPEQNGLKSDPDHLHGKKILELANSLNAKKIVFHSITHLTEKTHEELQELLPKNMKLSFDGMEIKI
ncbi:MAG: MBL fold metallo-hydrolase [Candidatus Aenigmarchaeota archaeon]|nr:MBL fold metallo-hydrolase [Candidatus Aenigmarchaeota archaeon]